MLAGSCWIGGKKFYGVLTNFRKEATELMKKSNLVSVQEMKHCVKQGTMDYMCTGDWTIIK